MRTNRLPRSWVALFAAALSFSSIAHAQDDTLRIGFQKSAATLSLLKAAGSLEQRLAEQGVEVKWTEFPGGPQLLEGLNVGSIDFGLAGETPPVFAQAAGADLRYVAFEPASPAAEAILVAKDSPIKSVADLKGKRVALNKGSNVHFLLVEALKEAGLNYSDIQAVYLPPADARAAFVRGSVDAWVIWDPFLAAAEDQLETRKLRDGEGLVQNYQFYLATAPYAENNPKVIATLIDEINKVGQQIKSDYPAAAEQVAPVLGLSETVTQNSLQRQQYGAAFISPEVVQAQQKIADSFTELKLIPKALNVSEVIWLPSSEARAVLGDN